MGGFASLQRNVHGKRKKTNPKTFPCRVRFPHSHWISVSCWLEHTRHRHALLVENPGATSALVHTSLWPRSVGSETKRIVNSLAEAVTLPQTESTTTAAWRHGHGMSLCNPSHLSCGAAEGQQPGAEHQAWAGGSGLLQDQNRASYTSRAG